MTNEDDEIPFSRLQPYDTSFKALIDDVTLPLLSYLYGVPITFAKELKEALFKQNAVKPPLHKKVGYVTISCGLTHCWVARRWSAHKTNGGYAT